MKIDSHHHFWRYSAEEYGWIGDEMSRLRRDFLPTDLEQEIRAAGIDGVVSVQARQTLEETSDLLAFAEGNSFIRGVVGWVPLVDSAVRGDLEKFSCAENLKGVRHVIQDEPDERYILRDDFNRGIAMLRDFELVYDILIFEKHLPYTLQFVDRHPKQVLLDHIAKPRIADDLLSPWQSFIVELSHRPNVYCKVSGMATEADWQGWSEKQLRPYFDTVLSAFGPKRLMFGSDWPVCLLAVEYGEWHKLVTGWAAELSESEQARILGETAIEAYKL
jgi:L-fuconolactonase